MFCIGWGFASLMPMFYLVGLGKGTTTPADQSTSKGQPYRGERRRPEDALSPTRGHCRTAEKNSPATACSGGKT